ncbi:hypothetical protein RFEPED_1374 [Rickettsia felis str. Pedreira]|uniref:Uncharacterized protein n=1 Tax=Rickettsia felis str. Pedreira TaxID=1359196 RepID=A0A0F3MWN0_RICFI|nr:hypothetical protein RFEPED_1374 [Rickettsia felis str. Pedreira]
MSKGQSKFNVIPAKAGIQKKYKYNKFLKLKARFIMDSCFRRNDIE